jgi:hypothetical protein
MPFVERFTIILRPYLGESTIRGSSATVVTIPHNLLLHRKSHMQTQNIKLNMIMHVNIICYAYVHSVYSVHTYVRTTHVLIHTIKFCGSDS